MKPVIAVFYSLTARMSLRVIYNVYLQAVLKMSTFCINVTNDQYHVNNVLLQVFPDVYQTLPKFIRVLNMLLVYVLFHKADHTK